MNQDDHDNQDNNTDTPASAREDKIFNNSYYNGDKLKDSEEYEFSKKYQYPQIIQIPILRIYMIMRNN